MYGVLVLISLALLNINYYTIINYNLMYKLYIQCTYTHTTHINKCICR